MLHPDKPPYGHEFYANVASFVLGAYVVGAFFLWALDGFR